MKSLIVAFLFVFLQAWVASAAEEDQILLNIDNQSKNAAPVTSNSRLILTGLVVVGLLTTTYYFVRRYKTSNTIHKSNRQIKVLTQHYLGPKKSLAIIRVAGESILIGVTDSNISMIKSLSLLDDEVPSEVPRQFNEVLPHSTADATVPVARLATHADELEEEFSFSGIKDSVSKKLRSMRSLS